MKNLAKREKGWRVTARAQSFAAVLFAVLLCSTTAARAADTAAAEALFRQGRELLAQENYVEACPKLEESHRLDPATGTLLAVAMCHEGLGRTASAWSEFLQVVSLSRHDGRSDRADAAQQRADALEPRLSYLTVKLSPEAAATAGVSVARGGVAIGSGALGIAVPVDPGAHVIEASAPGMKTWSGKVIISSDGQRETVEVPPLESAPADEVAQTPDETAATDQPVARSGLGGLRIGSLIAGGAGVVALGVGGVFALRAIGKNDESKDACDGNLCQPSGYEARSDARSAGNVATAASIVGIALAATGATLWFVGAPPADERDSGPTAAVARPHARVGAAPIAVEGGAGVGVLGSF
jgi:hypothetical protein